MECVPYEPGRQTTYLSLYAGVGSYCFELGQNVTEDLFDDAIRSLHQEQCLVLFNHDDIRPTQYGINKYSN